MKSISFEIRMTDHDGQIYTFSGTAFGVKNLPDWDGCANDVLLEGAAIGISKPVNVGNPA